MHRIISLLTNLLPYSLLRFGEDTACAVISRFNKTFRITYCGYSVVMPATDHSASQIYFRYLLTHSWRHEIYEQGLVESLLCGQMSGAWFIDGGANYGMFTLLAASLPSVAKCVAIESSPTTFNYLEETIRNNQLSEKVQCINAAISSISGETLYVAEVEHSEWSKTTTLPTNGLEQDLLRVDSISLDDLINAEKIPLTTPIFIKLDIEGNEPEAFQGLQQLFQSNRNYMILFEFHAGLLNTMEHSAKGFVNSIWKPELYVIYEIKSHLSHFEKINSLSDFEKLSDRCSASDFPNNLTNLLLSNRLINKFS